MQQVTTIQLCVKQANHFRLWCLTMAFILLWSFVALPPHEVKAATDCSTVTEIPVAECQALVALYNSTNGPNWINHENWLVTQTPCSWYGITCESGKHVTHIVLDGRGLTGNIPAEFGNLSGLQVLDLGGNQLSRVPAEIGNLSSLQILHLNDNHFGSVPAEIGNLFSLRELYLHGNQLTNVPAEIGNLSSLQVLFLLRNPLTSVPAEIGNLSNLYYLQLSDSPLTSVPAEIGKLINLQSLYLDNNRLTSVPAEIGNLTNLQTLFLDNNQLSGLPVEIGNLTNLQTLHLNKNQLTSVSAAIGKLTNLSSLHVSFNSRPAGRLPATLVQLRLYEFSFISSGICEPSDAAFQAWLASIPLISRSGVLCRPLEAGLYMPQIRAKH